MEVEPDWGESEGEGERERSGFRLASSSGEMEEVRARRLPRGSEDGVVILNLAGVEVHGKRPNEMVKGRTVPSESWDDDFEFQHTTTTSKLSPSLPSLAYDASQSHSRTSKRSSSSHHTTPTHSRHASTSTSSFAPPPSNPLSLSTRQLVTSSPQSHGSRPNSPPAITPLSSPVKKKKWLIYSTPADKTTFSPSSSTSSFPSPQVSNVSLPFESGSSAAFDSPQTTPRPFTAGKTVRREASEESTSTRRALPERWRRNSGFEQGKERQKVSDIDAAMEEPNWDTSEPEADEANFTFTPPPRLKPIADGSPTPTRKSKWKMAIGMGGGMTNTVGSTSIFEGGGISGRRTGAREILGEGTTCSFSQSTSFPKSLATSMSGEQFVVLGSRSRNLSEMDLDRDEVGEPSTFGRSSAKGLNLSRSNSATVDLSQSDAGSSRRSSLQFVRPDVPHRNSSTSSNYRSRTTSLRKSKDNLGMRGEGDSRDRALVAGEVTESGTETEGESAFSEEDTDRHGRRASTLYSSPPHASSATDFSSNFPTGLKALNRSQVSFKDDLTFDDSASTVRGKSVRKLKKKRRTSESEPATSKSREGSNGGGETISKSGEVESGQSVARTSIDGERRNSGGWKRSSMEQTARVTSPVLSPSRSQSLLRRVSGKLSSTKAAPLHTSGSDTISRRRLSLAKMMSKSSSDVPLFAFETETLPKKSLRSNSSTSLQNIAPPSSSSQQQSASRKGHKRSSSSIGSAAGIFMSRARGLSIGRSTTVEPTTSVSESVITSRLEGSKNSNVATLRGVPFNSNTNVPGNTNLSPISPRRPPVSRRQSKATPSIESPPALTVRQKRGHKSSFSLTSLSLNLRIFSSPPLPDSPTRPRTSMAIDRSNASFFDLDDDDLTERELMRRNSLSDLRIPHRITSSQKRIEEDLERVKEFARGIEQLKALREQYRQLIQMVTSRPSTPIPQTDVVLVDDFNGPPLQVVQRVSHAIKRLEIDYQSWWEQVEALVNLGDGETVSHDSPKESPALLASRRDRCTSLAPTQSSPSRGRGALPLSDLAHPTSEQAAAATRPIFQRAPSASSNEGESIEDRQREMLRGVLTSPNKSSSLPTRGPPSPRPTLAVLVPYLPRSVSNPNTSSTSAVLIPLPGPIVQPKSFLSYPTSPPFNGNPLSASGFRKVSRGGVSGIKDFLLRLKARASESEEIVETEKPTVASSKISKPSLPSRRPTGAFDSPPGVQTDPEKEGSRSVSDPTSFVKGKVPSTPTRFFGRIKTEQITPTSQRGNQIDTFKSGKIVPTMLVEGERTSPSSSEEEEDWDRDSPPRRDFKKLVLAPHLPSGSGIKRSMTMESGVGMGGNKERMVLTTEAMPELLKKVREVHARCEECIVRLKGLTV